MADNDKWKSHDDDNDEEEEEELNEASYKTVKDAVLFAIEVSDSMLTEAPSHSKKADKDTPTSAALKCAYHLMQQRIISNPGDMMGILLFGTEKSKFQGDEESSRGQLEYPHCYLLSDLDIPSANDVKALKALVEEDDEAQELLVPSKDPVSMANVLFCANQIFTTKASNFTSRRLFIVTNNDNPHSKDKSLRSAAAVRAKDLYDLGVTIELFSISRPDHEFDRSKFYDDIIYSASPSDPNAPASLTPAIRSVTSGDGISLLNSLLSNINSKAIPRRTLFNIPFEIAPGLRISVKGYILFKRQEAARSCYVYLKGETAQIAKGVTTQMAEDTARTVDKVEIRKAYKFGGDQITFTNEEIASLRNFGDPIIRIIGFKPAEKLSIWANMKNATFIYPSEEEYVGSTRVFSALWQKLLKSSKMGIAWFIPRRNASPTLAAVIPGVEKLGEFGDQMMPPGLWLVPLPYADDIRRNPECRYIRAPDDLTDKMRPVMEQLQLPKGIYDPRKYPNPALQWHYRILQALALDEDLPEKPEDKTIPKYKQIDKRAGDFIDEWREELDRQYRLWADGTHGDDESENKKLALGKRQRPASGQSGATSKKIKAEPGDAGLGDTDMRKHYENETLEKLKVTDLKSWLSTKSLSVSGKKANLVERIEGYFENY
ncbi:MAG: ATP-dependent DNA helicase II subunit 1 [Cirrosporium novae-zelandiae]|nr:MAG: ATP-dependent DNA helicase II subunit 1 [Cirrosporium novae-zelandiae]